MVGQQSKLKSLFVLFFVFYLSLNVYSIDTDTLPRPKVGLVLSGGGAKGLAHIGVLKVLEDIGVPVDYIGGTSIGSVVGGLYAMGYSANEIEEIVINQDWVFLLSDQLQRKSLSIKEKEDFDKYALSFPMENLRLKMPSGFGAGQNFSMLISKLAIPVADIDDFSQLYRPFLCVATDIEKGEEVVLDNGFLPDAIRASMAIPTVYTPIEIDGKLLVDGGLVNNFPVDHVIDMGADIIIGVNLGLKDYTAEELKNLTAVLEQSIFFQAKEKNKENQALCDILISPNVYESGMASFSNAVELIAVGEESANEVRPMLEKLVDSLGLTRKPDITRSTIDSILVESLSFEGLENVTEQFIIGKLKLDAPGLIAINDLEEGIERSYGTQFFKKINYRIEKGKGDSTNLIIRVEEQTRDLMRLGIRYDSDFKTQLLLNATFRNKFVKGSRLSMDLYLGVYPRFTMEYRLNSGWMSRKKLGFIKHEMLDLMPDFGLMLDTRNLEINYYEDGLLTSNYLYQYFVVKGFASSVFSNAFYIEAGASYEFSGLKAIVESNGDPLENENFKLYGMVKVDSYDERSYPKQGWYLRSVVELIKDFNVPSNGLIPVTRVIFKAEKVITPHPNFSLLPRIQAGVSLGDTVSPIHRIFLGGGVGDGTGSLLGTFDFVGFRLMEKMDYSILSLGLKMRVNVYGNHYLSFDNNLGKTSSDFKDLLDVQEKLYYGYGFQYGYSSFFGPVEFGLYNSNVANVGWIFFANIGYRF